MRSEEISGLMEQEQAACRPVEACGDLSRPGRSVGRFRRFFQGLVRPAVAQGHPCALPDDCWDSAHEQVWLQTANSTRDFLAKQSGPELRMEIHHHLFLS